MSTAWLRNKKYFENELVLSQGLSFNAHKLHITAIFTHLVVKLYKNKTLRCSFKATADAAHKSTIMYSTVACQSYQRGISAMVLKWSGIQQAGAPDTVAKGVNPCFAFGYWLQARVYKCVFHHHQLRHGAYTSGEGQASHGMNSSAFTIYTRDGQPFGKCADSKVTNHSVCQQQAYFYQARKHGSGRVASLHVW